MWLLALLLSPALGFTIQETFPAVARSEPEERWLDVRLNHFMAHNTDTFPMRYYFNQLNETDENVVILVGADWEISPQPTTEGLAYDIAQLMGASVFYTELRYYGKSRPTTGTSLAELRWLSVDQALGDLAQFIQHVRSDRFMDGQYSSAKVVVVGCSLGGSLATWLRLGYPQLADLAVAEGARLVMEEEVPEFLGVLTNGLREFGGEPCVAALTQAVNAIKDVLETSPESVTIVFNTCVPISSSPLDHSVLFWTISNSLTAILQSATHEQYVEVCQILTDGTVSPPMERLASLVSVENECLETRYTEVVAHYRQESYDDPTTHPKLALYQSCAALGSFPTTEADTPLHHTVPLDFYHQLCKDIISPQFDEDYITSAISRTNLLFGGLSHIPDYVVSLQGTLDGWRAVGPSAGNATAKAPVLMVEGATQCNVVIPHANASAAVVEARRDVVRYVNLYLNGVPFGAASANTASLLMLAATAIVAMAAL